MKIGVDLMLWTGCYDRKSLPLIDKVGRPGARGHRVAFLHPKAFGGTLLELVEAHEESSR